MSNLNQFFPPEPTTMSPTMSPAASKKNLSSPSIRRSASRRSSIRSKRMPRGHHRRVVSDTSSITGMITEEDLANIDFDNLQLESTVIPDHHLKDNLIEQMALYGGKFEPDNPSITLDFFLSLAVCNTVVISAEQQTKIVRSMTRQKSSKLTPLESIATPVKRIYKEFKAEF